MRRLIFGCLISLVLVSSLPAQVGLSVSRFQEEISKFGLENWEINQLIKESEENGLLVTEVTNLYLSNDELKRQNSFLFLMNSNLTTSLVNKETESSFYQSQLELKDKLLFECKSVHGSGTSAIKSLEWQLKKKKIQNTWLKASVGVTSATIIAIIIRELTR